ncbi:FKBP-type peptidyl-prolyl cis-trans isomerase [Arthrobacter sp. zg-Y1171]|uniref:FKBP-type peptidyl-prolyl cis-trans isomerase n=1 Tax=Arthrobacter sp. zg-Y1171 TaxID=2964610 RepID=UPI0021044C1C|nr:FKBP-type peptidyl-prolyl cis-trans isomerase [Arthrobacter sp. zg-Y1171]MCQ1995481.1 FKBP-type peptidyl-prolyl cis-trans isomerase [Arthrobacter sp. zg-Y1171]UWX80489.1 FKBP-type peptidyl-prolyl cis-trans isomerase [Arthrobacter sp. zg-Y1171]
MSFGKREYDRQKPEIDFPAHDAPTDLVIEDLVVGEGREVKAGDTVSTHYVGVAFSTGEEFDASWNRGTPLDFRVGVGQVIQGWDQGLLGMKVGGRRRLEIPSSMAYGDRGAGSAVAPGESLIFVVDLLGVR